MRFKAQADIEVIGFQIASMIDIVFLLLIFFLVASELKEMDIEHEVVLPIAEDSNSKQNEGFEEIVINVEGSESGAVKVGGNVISFNELSSELKRISSNSAERKIVIRGDKQALYGKVMRLMRACAEADIWNVTFATFKEEPQN